MRWTPVGVLLVILIIGIEAKKAHHKHHEKKTIDKTKLKKVEAENEKIKNETESELKKFPENPCTHVRCGPGRECVVQKDLTATCECVRECQPEIDLRRKVCSNYNETWDSDCHLYQMSCYCEDNKKECKDPEKYGHLHIDYYGVCKEITQCSQEELEDFPRRMREWLFNVMQDLARRKALGAPYTELEKEAESLQSRQWVNAVIWKFCDLDAQPADRSVSRHELFPLKAPLLAMEHCIAPFLDNCDSDDDHTITLKEWGICLGLQDGEIQDRCQAITSA